MSQRLLRGVDLCFGGFFLASWLLAGGFHLLNPYPGTLDLDLYRLYALAGGLGWLCGNLAVRRSTALPAGWRSGLRLYYFLGPVGVILLVRSLAPIERAVEAPFAALYACGVYAALFGVPVLLRPPKRR